MVGEFWNWLPEARVRRLLDGRFTPHVDNNVVDSTFESDSEIFVANMLIASNGKPYFQHGRCERNFVNIPLESCCQHVADCSVNPPWTDSRIEVVFPMGKKRSLVLLSLIENYRKFPCWEEYCKFRLAY